MKVVNRTQLKMKMVEADLTYKDLAAELSLSYQGLYQKIKGKRDFNESEIFKLSQLFGHDIFFLDSGAINLRTIKHGKYKSKNKSSK